tara:strand:+ start:386 stop:1000 length:615 start_codon:yes stop_codon:yes gene_type:complete
MKGKNMPNLILTRHGQSEWNKQNLFTGFKDVDLTEQGRQEASDAGKVIGQKGLKFDVVFTSTLKRAYHTAEILLEASGTNDHLKKDDCSWEMTKHDDLRERDYGDLTGLNKAETAEKYGDEQVHIWRRSYDVPPPGGEALKDVVERVKPYYEAHIKPELDAGKTVLVAAHGNSLRAMLIVLGERTPENINEFELGTGQPIYLDV